MMPPPAEFNVVSLTASRSLLQWDPIAGATGYRVTRMLAGNAAVILATLPPSATSYTDSTAQPGQSYSYSITASTNAGDSMPAWSAPATQPDASKMSQYFVTLGTGQTGSASGSSTDNLSLHQQEVTAASPEAAVYLAVTGTTTSDLSAVSLPTTNYPFEQGNAYVIRHNQTADGTRYNASIDGGLHQDTGTAKYTGWIALEDEKQYPAFSDQDYNDRYWAVTVIPVAQAQPPSIQDQISISNHATVDIHGVPLPDPSPTGESESDRIPNMAQEDAFTLNPSYSTTDVAVPLPGGELTAEFRRTEHIDSVITHTDLTDPYADHHWNSQTLLGAGWSTNIGSNVTVNFNANAPTGHDAFTANVTDDTGNTISYSSAGGSVYTPDIRDSFSPAALKGSLVQTSTGFVYTKEYGTKLYFDAVGSSLPHGSSYETYYRLTKVVDRNGNELDYSYSSTGDGTLVSSITDAATPTRMLSFGYGTFNSGTQTRLTSVTDPLGRVYQYQYSGTSARSRRS